MSERDEFRRFLEMMKSGEYQVRPGMDGNIRMIAGVGFVDERAWWLCGKPVGSLCLMLG